MIHDFTDMPYPDKSFKCVIFDPPHLIQGGDNSWLVKKYGRLDKDWQNQLLKGFQECMRVLDDYGTLILSGMKHKYQLARLFRSLVKRQ